jgi:large subunit ribosomal protein L30e
MSTADIKKLLKTDKLIIGTDRVVKGLRKGTLSMIYMSSNCPEDIRNEVEHYSKLTETKIEKLKEPNDELGAVCKKSFSISLLGVLK